MSHGGKREGAGRKPGSISTKTRELAEAAIEGGITPLDYMLEVLRNEAEPFEKRSWAAEKAAPYVHPKLANIEHTGKDGGPIQVNIASDDAGLG